MVGYMKSSRKDLVLEILSSIMDHVKIKIKLT